MRLNFSGFHLHRKLIEAGIKNIVVHRVQLKWPLEIELRRIR